jgi:hypothetical protein
MCLPSMSLVSRLVRLSLIKTVCFQLQWEMQALSLAKTQSGIGVENKRFYSIKEGPTLKPNPSNLGTCQGGNSIHSGLQNSDLKPAFFNMYGLYMNDLGKPIHTLVPCWMPKPFASKEPVYRLVHPSPHEQAWTS